MFLALTAASIFALLLHAEVGRFNRFVADDYCWGADLRERGWLAVQPYTYDRWTGKFAATALSSAVVQLGSAGANLVAPALITLLVGSLFALAREFHPSRLLAAGFAGVGAFAIVVGAPQIYQTFYWVTGATTYAPPLILAPFAIVAARRGWVVAVAMIGFVAAGFNETIAVVQLAAAGVLWVIAPSHRRSVVAFGAGGLAGAAIVVLAPGNAHRAALLGPPDLRTALWVTATSAPRVVVDSLFAAPGAGYIVSALGGLVGVCESFRAMTWPRFRAVSMLAVAVTFASIAPGAWALATVPPERAWVYAWTAILGWLFALGWFTGGALKVWTWLPRRWVVAACLISLVAPLSSVTGLLHRSEYGAWAASMDTLVKDVASTGISVWSPPTASRPLDVDLEYPTADPSNWVNECLARYLNVDEARALPQ